MSRESLFVPCPNCGATAFEPDPGPVTSFNGVQLGEYRRCFCCGEVYLVRQVS